MATKTVQEARLSINKSYKGDSLSATLNVSYNTDLVGLSAGREYTEVELPAEIAAFMISEIEKAETTLKADGAFQVAYAEPPPEPPPEEEAGD
tara:strand:- start:75 stop:353 length:279 start_codon:yes stop_codon:yes gene_type:complete